MYARVECSVFWPGMHADVENRLTGWADVRRAIKHMSGSKGLIEVLRGLFQTFGISEEISSDGGTEFMSGEVQKLLSTYGVEHRISSVGNPRLQPES